MPEMTDPMDALRSFQPAFSAKALAFQSCVTDPSLFVHADRPDGVQPRFTYFRTNGSKVLGIVIFTPAEPIEGVRCFALGYAVAEDERGQGVAQEMVNSALAEFVAGIAKAGIHTFHVEAVIDQQNIPSQPIASKALPCNPGEGMDNISGKPVYVYAKRFDAA